MSEIIRMQRWTIGLACRVFPLYKEAPDFSAIMLSHTPNAQGIVCKGGDRIATPFRNRPRRYRKTFKIHRFSIPRLQIIKNIFFGGPIWPPGRYNKLSSHRPKMRPPAKSFGLGI